jgi:hypothetical protein
MCNSFRATTPDDGPSETETRHVEVKKRQVKVVKSGTAQRATMKIVFVYIGLYQVPLLHNGASSETLAKMKCVSL